MTCFYYLEFARLLLLDNNKFEVYISLQLIITDYLNSFGINTKEIGLFDRLLKGNIAELPEAKIFSRGYVLHTLEASIWCLLTTNNYQEAILKAVNLGNDTDTTGAVTGGLAGLLYGIDSIPSTWINMLARKNDIEDLAKRMAAKLA
ncbi:MAG TPA: ADP-ribosylglycohydrolase family protein [Ohtaekwangia sp.]|uniref:ADP-ribosylglycohydrolase family protein n=1 Tax=Ohtaekwangia sp. TaxID=2066019 RepID=UPI002F946668